MPDRLDPNVQPFFARRGLFVPVEGGHLTISLPNETCRAKVISVHGRDVAVVELQGPLLPNVGHQYRTKDIVTVQRQEGGHGAEVWVPVDERKLNELERAERLAEQLRVERAPPPSAEEIAGEGDLVRLASPVAHINLQPAALEELLEDQDG